ncbi:hypothetical protein ACFY4K_06460 [Streptomyces leeuwenhoekii]|uniref:hypothetical protein n=1 Tax=Streptomyces leeuwenhoekii TaxID=1437453 RepID=UPI0036AD4C87
MTERRRTHISVAGLRARGWTPRMVRRFLGEPDLLRPHPSVRSAPPLRLYAVERVEAAERGDAFRAVSAAAARRSARTWTAVRRGLREPPGRWASGENPLGAAGGTADDQDVVHRPPEESP